MSTREDILSLAVPEVDHLAQIIREVDGANSLGAGALAEAILARLTRCYREQSNHDVHKGAESLPCYCWADRDHVIGQEVKRAAHTPPAAEAPGQEPVAVKPLEWIAGDGINRDERSWQSSENFGGYYFVIEEQWWHSHTTARGEGATDDKAKAAAQANYEQRIRSALVSAPPTYADAEARIAELEKVIEEDGIHMAELMTKYEALTYADAEAKLRPMSEAPRGGKEVIVATTDRAGCEGYLIAHWACDLSGSEQPPFEGWFYWTGHGFSEIRRGDLLGWCDLPAIRSLASPAKEPGQ